LSNDIESGGNGDDILRQSNAPNGADSLFGDAGNDTVDYGQRTGSVIVTPDNVANDGDRSSNERDNVHSSIDEIIGGSGADVLFGRDGPADTLIGGPGSDLLVPARGNDQVDGGPGNDQIRLRDLDRDDVTCGEGNDSVAADQRDVAASDCEKVRTTAAMSLALAGRPAYPTVRVRLVCPLSAFKSCTGRVVIRTLGKLRTKSGERTMTVGVHRFTLRAGSQRLVGVRVRDSVRPFIGRHGRLVRASLSAIDGAGPARTDPMRFRLLRG
jgi:Ca2+-binding RTX toxin-like protein